MASVNLDTTSRLDITCRRGDTFQITFTLKDDTGTALPLVTDRYSFLMQVRERNKSRSNVSAISRLVSDIGAGGVDLGNDVSAEGDSAAGIVIGSNQQGVKGPVNFQFNDVDDLGNVTVFLSASDMRKVAAGRYRYDFQYIVGSTEKTLLEGNFTVNEDVSKSLG